MTRSAVLALIAEQEAELADCVQQAEFWRKHGPPFDVGPAGERCTSFGLAEEYEEEAEFARQHIAELRDLLACA
jgi:hypothetical protein